MIRLHEVTKKFHSGRGIFDLSFHIERGEVFGYLGPNGAGKSTTIRTLMGFLRADVGTVQINGLSCWKNAAKVQECVGYLPGEIAFIESMTGYEFLELMRGMRKLKSVVRRDELIQRFDLDVQTPIRKMSKGMKQKVGIVTAFMHQPNVLVLDEPTSGLDPLMQQRFLELIEEEKQRGTTILMSSHMFPEIERVCDRVGIIKDGRLITIEDVKSLRAIQRKVFSIHLVNPAEVVHLQNTGFPILRIHGNEVDIEVRGNYNAFIQALSKVNIANIVAHELSLEEVFMHYYKQEGM